MDIDPGTVVANRYRISRPLGRGGMGEVFAAEHIRTGRPVAVKLLRSDSKTKSSAVARFRQEARAAGSINSDHVTQVLDVEEDSEHGVVLVFELLEGESLIDRLKRTGPIPFDELHPIIEQVWLGLADAHRVGIIHRDLKPSNVFLERRPDGTTRVKILDFGISKVPKEMGGETLTEMGQSLGTFSFMPPEQVAKAKTVDHRADIYACATMIYQSLTGQLPYSARNILVMVEMKAKADARKLAEAMGGPVDPRLEAFVAQGLARDPGHRFQTAVEALAVWRELRPAQRTPTLDPASSQRLNPAPKRSLTPGQMPAQRPVAPEQRRVTPPQRPARPTPQVDADSAATVSMPAPQFAEQSAPEEPPRIEPRMSPAIVAPRPGMGAGGTQPVRVLRPVTPVSPTAQANAARATGNAPPLAVVPQAQDKPASERSGPQVTPTANEDPKSNLVPSGYYVQPGTAASLAQPPSVAASLAPQQQQHSPSSPPSSGPRSPASLQPTPPIDVLAITRPMVDESTSIPASSSEGATQVYRPRANEPSMLNLLQPNPPARKRSSPWAFLIGAIAFLLVGFFIVAAIMRYLSTAPR